MKRITLITSIVLVAASGVFAQNDEKTLETLRASVTKVFLEQVSWALPESFLNSDLSPSDKDRLILQLANDTADCIADALVEYAALNDVPLSDLVSSDATIHFDGDSGKEYALLLDPCISHAWEAAGVSQE